MTGNDGAGLQKFYSDVFGWSLDTSNPGGYGLVRQGEMTGGIGPTPEGQSGHVTFHDHAT